MSVWLSEIDASRPAAKVGDVLTIRPVREWHPQNPAARPIVCHFGVHTGFGIVSPGAIAWGQEMDGMEGQRLEVRHVNVQDGLPTVAFGPGVFVLHPDWFEVGAAADPDAEPACVCDIQRMHEAGCAWKAWRDRMRKS